MKFGRIYPLDQTGYKPKWLHDSSTYPDMVKIPMEDGKVVDYYISVRQPKPPFQEAMRIIRKWNEEGYPRKHEKK